MTRFPKSLWAVVGVALIACAAPSRMAEGQTLRHAAGAYELEVLEGGAPAPRFEHRGASYVLGRLGERYTLRVWNRSGRRIEAVVSVDGRDVVDGRPADVRKRGYLVAAHGYVDIDGWRLSERQVAAFRFAGVASSYAAQTGSARNVGAIGVAVFPERRADRPLELPRPLSRRAPELEQGDEWRQEETAAERSAAAATSPAAAPAKGAGAAESAAAPAVGRGGVAREEARRRPGLGTGFGEEVRSEVREVAFLRAHASRPAVMLGARYNDREGLLALGIDVDHLYGHNDDMHLRETAQPFPLSRRFAPPPAGWRSY